MTTTSSRCGASSRSSCARSVAPLATSGSAARQDEREGRALADPALDAQPAAVRVDDAPRDGEPEPGAAAGAPLPPAIEHVREVLRGDAGAVIRDGHLRLTLPQRHPHLDVPAAGGERDRVSDEVRNHLEHAVAIARDLDPEGPARRGERDLLLERERGEHRERLVDDRVEPLRPDLDAEATRIHPRQVEQLADEPVHPRRRALHRLGVAPHVARVRGAQQERRREEDRLERILEIVRDDREDVIPRAESGTTIAEVIPSSRTTRSCSGSVVAAASTASGISSYSSERPVRITACGPPGPAGSGGQRRRHSSARSTFAGSTCATAIGGASGASVSGTSTEHQSAIPGTASFATLARVASHSRDEASSALASARKAARCLAASASARAARSESYSSARSSACAARRATTRKKTCSS